MPQTYEPDTILLGKLRVIGQVGAGAMGTVYEVEHLLTKHRRALKVLHYELLRRGSAVSRFVREAGVAGRLGSKRVVETFDAGQLEDGSPYVLMELLRGRSLAEAIAAEGRMSPARAARLVRECCEGVEAAHAEGIVHRDLKPGNIFLTTGDDGSEEVKILDFGVSKFGLDQPELEGGITAEGTVIGTPFYMSPEQATGQRDVDARTDVYALGVILYELLSGALPYEEDSFVALLVQVAKGDFAPLRSRVPSIDPELEKIVHRALHVDRDQRFDSVGELAGALAPFARNPLSEPLDPRAIKTSHSVEAVPLAETVDAQAVPALPIDTFTDSPPTVQDDAPPPQAVPPPPPRRARTMRVSIVASIVTAAIALAAGATWWIAAGGGRDAEPSASPALAAEPIAVPPVPDAQPDPVVAPESLAAPAEAPAATETRATEPARTAPRRRFERATKAGLRVDNPYGEP